MSANDYLAIQPIIKTRWVVQVGDADDENWPDVSTATATQMYDTLEEAIAANEGSASETKHGVKISPKVFDERISHGSETLSKVYLAFIDNNIPKETAFAIVNSMQARGILFRERADQAVNED